MAALHLGTASNAWGLAYTLEDPILGFSTTSSAPAVVNILPVTAVPGGEVTLDGQVLDFNFQDFFVFQVEVLSGSLASIGSAHLTSEAVGLGFYPGGIGAPSCGSVGSVTSCGQGSTSTPRHFFDSLAGGSDALFASYDLGDLPGGGLGPFEPGTVTFSVDDGTLRSTAVGSVAQVTLAAGGGGAPQAQFVPEPGTGLLLAGGLAGIAMLSRRRRS